MAAVAPCGNRRSYEKAPGDRKSPPPEALLSPPPSPREIRPPAKHIRTSPFAAAVIPVPPCADEFDRLSASGEGREKKQHERKKEKKIEKAFSLVSARVVGRRREIQNYEREKKADKGASSGPHFLSEDLRIHSRGRRRRDLAPPDVAAWKKAEKTFRFGASAAKEEKNVAN